MFKNKNKDKSIKYILAIETSCDDTSIAIYNKNHYDLETISSAKEQSNFGGVVPELASRKHEESLLIALNTLFKRNKIDFNQIDFIAYTATPGLKVCINTGKIFAKSLAFLHNKKIVEINHIHAHLFSFALNQKIEYPFIGLVASGGHTTMYYVKSLDNIKIINETLDDAIGEVYDKIGRKLDIRYPCGPKIDKMFDINKTSIKFINKKINSYDPFSFSGLKSQVINYINKNKEIDIVEILSSFQYTIMNIVVDKIDYYCDKFNTKNVVIGGGVAANNYLRQLLLKKQYNIKLPEKFICGDNALMIAILAYLLNM